MLTREGCRRRRQRLFAELPDEVEWVIVADPLSNHRLSLTHD